MNAKDIMVPISAYLHPDETLKEAVAKMKKTKRSHGLSLKGMVVLDSSGKLMGIVSVKDILRATLPHYLSGHLQEFTWEGMLEEQARKAACKKVRDIMSTKIITAGENDPLMKCVNLLIDNKLQRLPVVNREGKAIGIIYIRDIYNLITEIFDTQAVCKL